MHFDPVMSQVEIKDGVKKLKQGSNQATDRLDNMNGRMESRLGNIESVVTAIYQAVQKPSGN